MNLPNNSITVISVGITQETYTYSKLTIETLEKGVNHVQSMFKIRSKYVYVLVFWTGKC